MESKSFSHIKKYGFVTMLYSLALIHLFSCKKPEERRCFKSNGDESMQEILFDNTFDTLYLEDDLEYEIVPDTLHKVTLLGGTNLLNHIAIKNNNGRLTVANNNRCNFLRDISNRVRVQIHVETLHYLDYSGTTSLTFLDTLHSGELRVYNRDGAGTMTILADVSYLEVVIKHGWGDFYVAGTAGNTYLACNTNSFCDARLLRTQLNLNVLSMTQGDMLVNANNVDFTARIKRGGNILYWGEPEVLTRVNEGEGRLKKGN